MKVKPVNTAPVPKGILVVIGGKEDKGQQDNNKEKPASFVKEEIIKYFVELTATTNPIIEVITSASSKGDASFADYKQVFNEVGVQDIGHIHHDSRHDAMADNLTERLDRAHGIFFAGGDQLKLTSVYGGTPTLTYLKQLYIKKQVVIAGTSAGAMALSTPMIYAGSKEVEEIAGSIKVTTGLEFLKDVCIDTHFVHRGRLVRLCQVIATNPTSLGIGIEEDTAIIVRNGIELEVAGSGTVLIINGFYIDSSNIVSVGDDVPIQIRNLRLDILSKGETYILQQLNPPHI